MAIRGGDIRNFSYYYPHMADSVIDARDVYGGEQLLLMEDGRVLAYNDLYRTYRELPHDPNEMTEGECRKEFGRALARIMDWKRVGQIELSDRTGISQPAISSYICGTRTPSFYAADKIAKALDMSLDEFRYIGF